jgi:Cu+-exporting ATPase
VTLGTALGQLGQRGLHLRHTGVVFDLSSIDTIAFDKTGTLTSSAAPAVTEHGGLSEWNWRLVRAAAAESVHPISRAVAASGEARGKATDVVETPGLGLSAIVDGQRVRIGSAGLVGAPYGARLDRTHVSVDEAYGWVRTTPRTRVGIDETVRSLSQSYDVRLISGDHDGDAVRWQPLFGQDMTFRQSPGDKLAIVERLKALGRRVLMIGDGLNDAGAFAAADVGIAVSEASACVVPACDAVVAGHHVRDLPAYLRYARRARHVIVACFALSLAYNAIGLALALSGMLTPLGSAILMPVSSLTVVGISAGAMRWSARRMLPA